MSGPEPALKWSPFNATGLGQVIQRASGATGWVTPPRQVQYLACYLSHPEMACRSMLIEDPYTDRHYLKEYQDYYATTLRPPPSKTTRIHFFSLDLDDQVFAAWAEQSADPSGFEALRAEIQKAYLGFAVVRPIPSAPIGRTLLKAWRDEEDRQFGPPPVPHRVHLFGLTLKVHGIPFHQQDQAVGACATAAIWCALSAVMRRDGVRAATPSAITAMANERSPEHRAFPAVAGLTRQQMIGAISAVQYSPDVIKPSTKDPWLFHLILKAYVRSGIPVVLQLLDDDVDEGHAVTVVGYREADENFSIQTAHPSYQLNSRRLSRVYVHDDRLGPYARMRLEADGNDPVLSVWHHEDCEIEDMEGQAYVSCAIAPLYPKIRMSASDLCALAGSLVPVLVHLVGAARKPSIRVEPFFSPGGDYCTEVLRFLPLTPARVAAILQGLRLSRYVGVIRFYLQDDWILDALVDPTDILRDGPGFAALIACIPASDAQVELLREVLASPHVLIG